MNPEYVKLGVVGKPRGLAGEFFVSGRDTSWPSGVKTVRIGDLDSPSLTLQYVKEVSGKWIAKIRDLNSREAIENFKLKDIWCLRSQLSVDYEDEYLWQDLLGLKVFSQAGDLFGEVQGFENFGAHDNITIKSDKGKIDLPFVSAYFDMSFSGRPEHLVLIVDPNTLDELWLL